MGGLRKAAALVAKVRARFPDPVKWNYMGTTEDEVQHAYADAEVEDIDNAPYCVGGAFVATVNGSIPFPGFETLGQHLIAQNPALNVLASGRLIGRIRGEYGEMNRYDARTQNWSAGKVFANLVIGANDARKFSRAWALLEEALAY